MRSSRSSKLAAFFKVIISSARTTKMKITETVTAPCVVCVRGVWCERGGGEGGGKAFSVVRVHTFGFKVSDLGFRVWGSGLGV